MHVVEKRAGPEPPAVADVAVVAATAAEARAAAAALRMRVTGCAVFPAAFAAYLAEARAPARVILCATRGPAARAASFLERAVARLLWPAPPADIDAAIGGLREPVHSPGLARRARARSAARDARRTPGRLPAALLLEGAVDHARARGALAAAAEGGPRDWIVESPRHVRLRDRTFARLAGAGVRWSALEPIELVAVYAGRGVVRRGSSGLPRGTPVWIRTGRAPR
jgi:hypothetical protein